MSVTFDDGGSGFEYFGAWTIHRVCEHLSISRATCYRMIASGDLERITVGRRGARITATSVRKHLSKSGDE